MNRRSFTQAVIGAVGALLGLGGVKAAARPRMFYYGPYVWDNHNGVWTPPDCVCRFNSKTETYYSVVINGPTTGDVRTWTEVLNDARVVGNRVRTVTTGPARVQARAERDLS